MRLGIISDIHADIAALVSALHFLDSQGVDQIICAGDLIDKGLDAADVVRLMEARSILCVAGNHDHGDGRDRLDPQGKAFLKRLPDTLDLTLEGKKLLVAHGAPWSDNVYVYPKTERHVFRRIAQEARADIVILGHTHVPLVARYRDMWIFNPGSVCRTYTAGSHTCGILTLPESSFEVFEFGSQQRIEVADVRFTR
jgi:putative phosphoesterase